MQLKNPEFVLDRDEKKVYYFEGRYSQRIVVLNNEIIWWNCTCKWASVGRWGKGLNEKKCKHIKECEEIIRKGIGTPEN